MTRLILRIIALALAFAFVFPRIGGISFTGEFFPDALVYSTLFSVTAFLVNAAAYIATAAVSVATLGLALLVIWPLRLLGWWALAAYQLLLLAEFFPGKLHVDGWQPALLAGLVVMVVNALTTRFAEDFKRG
ncbi:MAG: phage holin family protein [Candidatus Obscuribacterales bacterium]|nr:phage holin family protein [Candidatus Obscuribacterales bacterium]